eukprot:TRINITY_DN8896_c0_g1_i1.p1 TRINITY_DN8896_c0_g1~~TRINITY_DN8896_c0_g1_i1.p1  ORF type:complete len:99 (-),score=21.70 TRINITY_DN8896_c0_g1_i1:2-298(-)
MSSQKNMLSRIGIREPRDLKVIQSHISNLATTFKPIEIHPSKWTKEHVEEFFLTQGDTLLAKYASQFLAAGIDGEVITTLKGERLSGRSSETAKAHRG